MNTKMIDTTDQTEQPNDYFKYSECRYSLPKFSNKKRLEALEG